MADSLIARNLLDEDSALLLSCSSQSWIGARRLTRAWTKVRDREMEECAEFLDEYAAEANANPTLFVTAPKASHETYDGVWAHQSTEVRKGEVTTREGVTGVTQVLQEVFAIADFDALDALLRRREREDDREAIFDFQDGQGEQLKLVFPFLLPTTATETMCMETITETDLLTIAPAAYLFATRAWAVDQDTHTASLIIIFRKVEWNAWGHDAYAEDYYEYLNVGVPNTEEIITRTWVHIQNADVPTAVDDLRAGNQTPSTHTLLSINVANAGNGGCTISVREQKKNDGSATLYGQEIIRAHGWPECKGIKYKAKITLSRFETQELLDAQVASLDLIATPPTGGYIFVGYDTDKDGHGYWHAIFRYEYIVWSGDGTERTVSDVNFGDGDLAGLGPENGHSQGWQICALTKDNVRTTYDEIEAPANFVISRKNISVNQNGEFSLTGNYTATHPGVTSADALVVMVRKSSGSATASQTLQRVWFRRDLTAKTALIQTTPVPVGAAVSSATIDSVSYVHISVSVTDHHDGAYTVTQTMRWGAYSPFRSRHDLTDEFMHLRDYVLKRVSGGAEVYEWYIRHVMSKLFTSPDDGDDAWDWATVQPTRYKGHMVETFDDTTGTTRPVPTVPTGYTPANTEKFMPSVKYVGGGTWQAFIEFYTDTTWTTDTEPVA